MANKKTVIFQDHFKITKPSETVQNFNDFVGAFNGSGPKRHLRVQLEATHSAIRNRNNRFYIPSRMNEGSVTFLKGKPAPILKHHGSDEDPVGKVRSIEYIPTVPETLRDSKEVSILTDSTASISAQQKAARKFLQNDFISRDDWKGLGYINITADIMDPKAIQQIEDKLFDAVSVSFKSDHAICSLCGKDWMAGDICDHEPGKAYKDDTSGVEEKAVLIPGNMFYRECSLVNFDADPHSAISILSLAMNDAMEESCSDIITIQDTLGVANVQWEVRDSEEAVSMKTIQVQDGIAIELSDTEEKIFDIIKKHYPEDSDKQVAEATKEIEALRDKENMFPDQVEADLDEETAIVYAYEAIKFGDTGLDSEVIYTGIIEELQNMAKEGLLTEDALKDTVLSTETRKKMGEKSFCGPERSFPVPDCAHVTAARRLIGKYKGPGDKSSILACVSRKAKAMGCSGGSKDAIVPPPAIAEENPMDKMSDDEVRGMFDKVETELLKRELVVKRECNTCMTSQKCADKAEKELEGAKKSIEDREATLALLRDELRNEFVNFKHIADELITQKLESRNLKAKYAGLVAVVSKQKDNLELATGEFKDSEDLDKAFDSCLEKAKLEELLKKMHDGTVREPEGSVENPTINNDKDNTQSEPGLSKQERAILSQVKTFIKNDNMSDARELYDRMKQYETLRESITWEGLLAESNGSGK